MYIMTTLAVIVNIVAIVVLLIGLLYTFNQPKSKAIFGYIIAGSMIMYIMLLALVALFGLVINHNVFSFILFLCIISPFIIGKLVKYNTLKKYTIVQIICFIVSLVTMLLKF